MSEKLFETYREDILTLFKGQFKKLSAKHLNLTFKDVLQSTYDELGILQTASQDVQFLQEWFQKINSFGFIYSLVNDSEMNEIIFHSNKKAQLIYPTAKEDRTINDLSLEDYQLSLEILALRNNISWNYADPFASFALKLNGFDFRVTLIHYSTSASRISKIFLRLMKSDEPTLALFKLETLEENIVRSLISEKKNILVSGSTGSGKTTFIRALLKETDQNEHIIILEDTHEILPTSSNQTSLLSQQDMQKKSLKDYCAYALRMSPDRLIVGEMRSTEVVPFMLAMNTGHKGLMSTIHANSCVDAVSRIALLFSLYSENKEIDFNLITKLACRNIDYVVHMENKKIKEIARIIGSEQENIFYETVFSAEI